MAEATLPTEEEIAKLPRWARVAFAARCARRAQPFFLKAWPFTDKKLLQATENAILISEQSATKAEPPEPDDAYDAFINAAYPAAAYAAASADLDEYVAAPAKGVDAAAKAGVETHLIRSDFDLLLRLSFEGNWTDESPVPTSVFPALNAVPVSAEKLFETDSLASIKKPNPSKLLIDFEFDSDTTDPQEAADALVELFREMNEYSLLKFGKGLTVDEFKHYLAVGDFAEVR
ncbi:MAG: hypothetical protein ACRC8S_07620 [Fimbriiglobus sp.]